MGVILACLILGDAHRWALYRRRHETDLPINFRGCVVNIMDSVGETIAFCVGALFATFVLTRVFNFIFKKIRINRYEYLSFICVSAIGIIIPTIKIGKIAALPYLVGAIIWLIHDLTIRRKIDRGAVNPQNDKLSDDLVVIRASAVLLVILDASFQIQDTLIKNFKSLSDFKPEEKDQVLRILAITLLAHAQKLYWERFVKDEESARKFEIALYGLFYRNLNIDPIPHVKDFAAYIAKIGDQGQFQYVGSKICNEILKRDDGVVMHQIGSMFGTMLPESFLQPLINTQKITLADGPQILSALGKYKEYFDKSLSEDNSKEEEQPKNEVQASPIGGVEKLKINAGISSAEEKLGKLETLVEASIQLAFNWCEKIFGNRNNVNTNNLYESIVAIHFFYLKALKNTSFAQPYRNLENIFFNLTLPAFCELPGCDKTPQQIEERYLGCLKMYQDQYEKASWSVYGTMLSLILGKEIGETERQLLIPFTLMASDSEKKIAEDIKNTFE